MSKILVIILLFILPTIIWSNILVSLFAGSLADLFGMAIMLILSFVLGISFYFLQKRIEKYSLKVIVYFLFLIVILLIHPFFHFSSPKPYEVIKITNEYLDNYDKINYYHIYEEDHILRTLARYKFQKVLPEKGFNIYFGIPNPTEYCPGCKDETSFIIECNGLNCNSNYKDLTIQNRNDTVFFSATYNSETVKFYYHKNQIKPNFNIGKDPYISAIELKTAPDWGYYKLLQNYLERKSLQQISKK